eukprot:2685355-Pleurochrysis_carterae.AAC.1
MHRLSHIGCGETLDLGTSLQACLLPTHFPRCARIDPCASAVVCPSAPRASRVLAGRSAFGYIASTRTTISFHTTLGTV